MFAASAVPVIILKSYSSYTPRDVSLSVLVPAEDGAYRIRHLPKRLAGTIAYSDKTDKCRGPGREALHDPIAIC